MKVAVERGVNGRERIKMRPMKQNSERNSIIPVVIMAGGLGTRAASIDPTVPKPLIKINSKPVLQYEIECLVSQGFTDIILTVSHMKDQIIEYFSNGSDFGCSISYFEEDQPLGNAGAVFKLWAAHRFDDDFLLLNADSMFDIDFHRFVDKHRASGALATLFAHSSNHVHDSGVLITDSDGWVEQWLTKEDQKPQWYKNNTNAGLHVLSTSLLSSLVADGTVDVEKIGTEVDGKIVKVDLDRQILKPLAGKHKMLSVRSPEYVKDMGTPERFEQVCKDLRSGRVSSRNLKKPQKAIFLDRDGTINKYVGFLRDIEQFELIPTAAEAIKLINSSEYLCIVATNQPVVARGEVTLSHLDEIHNKMETLLGEQGAYLDGIFRCIHHPHSGFEEEVKGLKIDCDCRKPKPGMLIKASKAFNINLSDSWMIGDGWRDIQCGRTAGTRTILLTGEGTETEYNHNVHSEASKINETTGTSEISSTTLNLDNQKVQECEPDFTAPDLLSAVKIVLGLSHQ